VDIVPVLANPRFILVQTLFRLTARRLLKLLLVLFHGYYDFSLGMSFFKKTESFRHAA
jgi:hypothetical protein